MSASTDVVIVKFVVSPPVTKIADEILYRLRSCSPCLLLTKPWFCGLVTAGAGQELVQLVAVAFHLLPDVVQHSAAAVPSLHLVDN